ncbi:hypothetical protein V1282_004697 [Nitrobacteraceae bacterium AZCC 2146]
MPGFLRWCARLKSPFPQAQRSCAGSAERSDGAQRDRKRRPLLIGVVTAVTASQKAGMAVLVLFFVAGLALLARVREA